MPSSLSLTRFNSAVCLLKWCNFHFHVWLHYTLFGTFLSSSRWVVCGCMTIGVLAKSIRRGDGGLGLFDISSRSLPAQYRWGLAVMVRSYLALPLIALMEVPRRGLVLTTHLLKQVYLCSVQGHRNDSQSEEMIEPFFLFLHLGKDLCMRLKSPC